MSGATTAAVITRVARLERVGGLSEPPLFPVSKSNLRSDSSGYHVIRVRSNGVVRPWTVVSCRATSS